MKRLFYFFKNYLGFSRRESKGFLLVLPALFLLYWVPSVYDFLLQQKHERQYEAYLQEARSKLKEWEKEFSENKANKAPVMRVSNSVDSVDLPKDSFKRKKEPQLKKMDFAEADSVVLQIVPGIGQTLASRIVKFRESLGGFYQKEQLMDVYGLKEEVALRVLEYFEFNSKVTKKINLNETTIKELANHPYIDYGYAKVILAYKKQHGEYETVDELLNIKIFSEDWLDRIKPYLTTK
ncbi:helix-hairpin-helix domain-containing protein [Echinicola jeungdonensis]|uniref:ComEA family DNA-binding protein n=1 Tax=Echinicola jeungdonensis TaxID=709343 RepID=A0ABV5J0V7_9BACT|nr:helix-hairpin-helix domain-containing protein [Echinicola jeungdonensis]MDN3668293.1 helix-hairpin-helix domain-containing protein [Echinicola jeungdonensis]